MTSNLSGGRLIAGIGGAVLLISLFLKWYGIEVDTPAGFPDVGNFGEANASAWDAFGLWDIILLVIGAIALLPAVLDVAGAELELPFEPSQVITGTGAFAVVLILFKMFIDKPGGGGASFAGVDVSVGLKIGAFIGLAGAVAVAFGGFKQMQEGGSGAAAAYTPPPGAPAAEPPPPPPPSEPPPAATG